MHFGGIMQYRKADEKDIDAICRIVKHAVAVMEENGIHQWDELYPTQEDLLADIHSGTLFVGIQDEAIAVLYVLNKNQDEAYFSADWQYTGENICVIHRLCVNPKFQNQGIAKSTLSHIEKTLKESGTTAIRLDVFTENPFALRLYGNAGYRKTGSADWRKGKFYLMEKVLDSAPEAADA